MFLRLITLLGILPSVLLGQSGNDYYIPLSTESERIDSLIEVVDQKLNKDLAKVPKAFKEEVSEIHQQKADRIKTAIEEGYYYFDPEVNAYLNGILEEIFDANPEIPREEIQLFLSIYPWPNAVSIGQGTLELNIGLLRRLENESQLAFVLCHEIAHYTLDHSNQSIEKKLKTLYNGKVQKDMKKIKNQKYRAHQKAMDLLREMAYETRKHSRERETEADEMGLKYLKNTKYDAREAEKLLQILDEVDKEKYEHSTRLATVFNAEKYPFKQKWIEKEDLLAFDGSEDYGLNADSLKTHPDCSKRIGLVLEQLAGYEAATVQKDLQEKPFSEIVSISDFELLESYLQLGNYGRCIYHALKLLNEYPNDAYIYATISKCFHLIHTYQSNHDLGNSVAFPSKEQDPTYQETLRFLHNMRLRELAKVNYYFMEGVKDQFMHSEDFLFAWIMANDLMAYSDETDALKAQYMKQYADGYYLEYLKEHETNRK